MRKKFKVNFEISVKMIYFLLKIFKINEKWYKRSLNN